MAQKANGSFMLATGATIDYYWEERVHDPDKSTSLPVVFALPTSRTFADNIPVTENIGLTSMSYPTGGALSCSNLWVALSPDPTYFVYNFQVFNFGPEPVEFVILMASL